MREVVKKRDKNLKRAGGNSLHDDEDLFLQNYFSLILHYGEDSETFTLVLFATD